MLHVDHVTCPIWINIDMVHAVLAKSLAAIIEPPWQHPLPPRQSASISSKPNALGCPCGGWRTRESISSAVSVRLVSLHPTYRVMAFLSIQQESKSLSSTSHYHLHQYQVKFWFQNPAIRSILRLKDLEPDQISNLTYRSWPSSQDVSG